MPRDADFQPDRLMTLSVRQPWAWAIATQGKTVENRTWKTNYRGPVAIHASAKIDQDAVMPTERAARKLSALKAEAKLADRLTGSHEYLRLGRILAVADLVSIHHASSRECPSVYRTPSGVLACSPWAQQGHWHWILESVRLLPEPVRCKGRLGLWKLPEEVEKAVREQLEASRG